MEYLINLKSTQESNYFLRALWSQLREEDGIFGWYFTPYKDTSNKIINLGRLSTSKLSRAYQYKIKYKIRGVIYKLIVEGPVGEEVTPRDNVILKKAIEKALNYNDLLIKKFICTTFKTSRYSINNIKSDLFQINNCGDNEFNIIIYVDGFDSQDISFEFKRKSHMLKDFLSTQISHAIYNSNLNKIKINEEFENIYLKELWLDTYPAIDGGILLSYESVKITDMIICNKINKDLNSYIKASRLYHTACKYEDLTYKSDIREYDLSSTEISNLLFMSSLEVLSDIIHDENERCPTCNREIFSIRKKVINLIEKFSDGYMNKKEIDSFYKKRSSYVHDGIFFSDRSYTEFTTPQLTKSGHGVVTQRPMINLTKLRETIGYIFRNLLEKIIFKNNINNYDTV